MVLAVDIGNSNVVLGLFEGEKLRFVSRLKTDKGKTPDDWACALKSIFELYEVRRALVEGAILSSVVPQLTQPMAFALERTVGKRPLIVGPGIKTGLNIRIDDPAQLGSDLCVDAVAALSLYTPPIVIFDMGTATTVSVLDAGGTFLGGASLPGVRVGLDALSSMAAQLPQVDLSVPQSVIGTNTIDSMRSGAVFGTAAMVDGMVARIEEQLGAKATVLATGGNSREIAAHCRTQVVWEGDLLLKGLLRLWQKNQGRA